jgi:hypothetical protein
MTGHGNDYVGKGLSGGKLIIRPSDALKAPPARTIMAGNTVLYAMETTTPPVMYSQPWSPMPSTTVMAPEYLSMVDLEPVEEEDDLMRRFHQDGDLETKGRVDILADMSGHDEFPSRAAPGGTRPASP